MHFKESRANLLNPRGGSNHCDLTLHLTFFRCRSKMQVNSIVGWRNSMLY